MADSPRRDARLGSIVGHGGRLSFRVLLSEGADGLRRTVLTGGYGPSWLKYVDLDRDIVSHSADLGVVAEF